MQGYYSQQNFYGALLDSGKSFNLISIDVYSSPYGDCTNGGISSKTKTLYIPCEDGPTKSTNVDRSHIMLEEHRGGEYWAIKPVDEPKGMVGPMAGGNLAYSSDSRVKRVYHIHDRFETQEMYDHLSV